MADRLKRRMVGATLLVAVVVIVVPELFDDGSSPDSDARPAALAGDGFSSRIIPLEEVPEPVPTQDVTAAELAGAALEVSVAGPESEGIIALEGPSGGDVGTLVGAASAVPDDAAERTVADAGASPAAAATESRVLIPVPRPKPQPESPLARLERIGLSAWAIRLGRFSPSREAIKLRDRLRHAGFDAFVQLAYGEEGSIARVYVGPELDRDQAETARRKLHAEQDMDGVVVRFPGG